MYINRALEKIILDASELFCALIVTGSRQAGKTTLLKHLAGRDREYVTLDSPIERELAINEPALFVERHKPPIIIDEIQYAPNLLPYIRMHIDTHQSKGDFWLTGSQKFHMMKNVSESLAGRIAVIEMYGLSQSEIDGSESEAFTCDHEAMSERYKTREPQNLESVFERIFKMRWDSQKTLEVSAMSGKIFQTYVVSEILKSYHNTGKQPPIYYYRDTDGKEIDVVLEYNGTVYPVEIKKTGNPGKDSVKNFAVLDSLGKPIGEGAVICLFNKVMPIDRRNWIIPVCLV